MAIRRRSHRPRADGRVAALAADAVALYNAIARGSRPADFEIGVYCKRRAIRDYARRGEIAELVYAALRRARFYEAVASGAAASGVVPARVEGAAPFLCALERRTAGRPALISAFADATRGSAAAFAALAGFLDDHGDLDFLADATERFAAAHAFPTWVVEELARSVDEASLAALLDGLNAPAPLTVRANTYAASADDVARALEAEGFSVERGRLSPAALVLDRARDPFASAAFRAGLFELQDEGSQVVSMLVDARPGSRVLDLCAGSGGKTLHLGALMRGRGEVFAYDTDARRLANGARRVRRSGLQNVRVLRSADDFARFEAREAGSLDRVLVDAPCSGLGAVRRAPDIKLRVAPALVELMVSRQREILGTAARLVRHGGRLVYATCSVLPRENVAIVDEFLASHDAFRLVPVSEAVAELAEPAPPALVAAAARGDALALAPHLDGTDGFYVAVLERR
jgi:16S rRNA (cytosine967-C5)-methyltransferase